MKEVAIYGKGGIGKSTLSANISAALSLQNKKILQISCDPKHDSTRLLLHGKRINTVLDYIKTTAINDYRISDILFSGFNNIGCIEAGGPEPGVGCAGRGIITAFEFLEKFHIKKDYDIILYDVLGDVVCGGFAVPIRREYSESDNQYSRQFELDPLNYPELWFFGQPRIPCTYLDKRDYVYGSQDKIVEALHFFKENIDCELIAVVNSPGASLIGDNLKQIVGEIIVDIPLITFETPGYSKQIWQGYSQACQQLIKEFAINDNKNKSTTKKRVNILGLSIYHKYYQGDLIELKRLLELCSIEINCVLCCKSSLDEIKNIANADLNIVLDSGYGFKSAKLLEELFDIPCIVADGLPIGFESVELFFNDICKQLACDNSAFIIESEKARALSYINISRVNSITGLPKGVSFAIQGTASQCLAYTRYFIQYFGMVADAISIFKKASDEKDYEEEYLALYHLLSQYDMENTLQKDILATEAQIVFADGNIIAKLKTRKHSFCGIEINLPTLGYIDIVPKTHLGITGSLFLCEQVLNALLF